MSRLALHVVKAAISPTLQHAAQGHWSLGAVQPVLCQGPAVPCQTLTCLGTSLPSFVRFLKGLPLKPALLSDELKALLGMDPTPGSIKYIIATQVRPRTWAW